ncbi:MAG TPA: ORF6N domain-containing protein [Verrucomicrobiae bacterium]|nr:ORF6N domain-containing protein [Verrucomicrobiae bacterium]
MPGEIIDNHPSDIDALIVELRGQKVILDADLAAIYGVPTKRLNEQVKRNASRFPPDFASQPSKIEIKKGQGGGKMSRVGHGSARVMSRVDVQKRPVFIRLSRCHGSGPPGNGITKHRPSLGCFRLRCASTRQVRNTGSRD